jgi:hypothetical protein
MHSVLRRAGFACCGSLGLKTKNGGASSTALQFRLLQALMALPILPIGPCESTSTSPPLAELACPCESTSIYPLSSVAMHESASIYLVCRDGLWAQPIISEQGSCECLPNADQMSYFACNMGPNVSYWLL